jgi:hypothetical protein
MSEMELDAFDMQSLTVQDCADHLALAAIDGRVDLVRPYAETFRKAVALLRRMHHQTEASE